LLFSFEVNDRIAFAVNQAGAYGGCVAKGVVPRVRASEQGNIGSFMVWDAPQ
jgi:hypothetical protein